MAASATTAATSALWTEMKLSGRKIKERFYTQVEAPEDADEDLPHFRCRCGKVRIQSLKHGYTNLKQHVMLKHPDWLLECADEMQMTPPLSPKAGATAASGKATKQSKAGAATSSTFSLHTAVAAVASGRKKRRVSAAADSDAQEKTEQAEESPATPPAPPAAPAGRRKRAPAAPAAASSAAAAPTSAAANGVVKKRTDYISWDDYFMSVAFLSAMRSKDPSTQVGACIVNEEKKIVGIGYNGFPNGCSDETLPWARESTSGDPLDTKYPFVCHAEMNAILNKNSSDLKNCTIYVALFPCNECAKLIIQSGIKHIVFLSDKYHDDWKMVASRRLLDMAGVEYRQHHTDKSKIVIDFTAIA